MGLQSSITIVQCWFTEEDTNTTWLQCEDVKEIHQGTGHGLESQDPPGGGSQGDGVLYKWDRS